MTETRVKGHAYASIDELATESNVKDRWTMAVRRHFDIGAFGVNARRADAAGVQVISEHDELGPASGGHEELYVVLSGRATFTVDGNEIDAAGGGLVFVRDPALRRGAVATEPDTVVLCIGGKRGEAFAVSLWEQMATKMWTPYLAGDYDVAIEALEEMLADHSGNPSVLFNLACSEALAGRTDDALEHLRAAATDETFREYARTDADLEAIRSEPRFTEVVGG